ncbi:MAG: AMP-binding protein [Myxococcales bacterium]|nr:AMP-binding protein [Myxococcales bacterium]
MLSGCREAVRQQAEDEARVKWIVRATTGHWELEPTDNLYERGASSLDLLRVASATAAVVGRTIELAPFIAQPTVRGLVTLLTSATSGAAPKLPPGATLQEGAPFEVAPSQEPFLFVERAETGPPRFNEFALWRVRGPLQLDVLRKCLGALAQRHEALRGYFTRREGRWVQETWSSDDAEVPLEMLEASVDHTLTGALRDSILARFPIASAPNFRAVLLRQGEDDWLLGLVAHHAICDGYSLSNIVVPELSQLYSERVRGDARSALESAPSFARVAARERHWVASSAAAAQLDFWANHLRGVEDIRWQRSPVHSGLARQSTGWHLFELEGGSATTLAARAREMAVTPFTLAFTAYRLLIHRLYGLADAPIGIPAANRLSADADRVVGALVNTVVLRVVLAADDRVTDVIQKVHAERALALANQRVPFSGVVRQLGLAHGTARSPEFPVGFSYQERVPDLELVGCSAEAFDYGVGGGRVELALHLQERGERLAGRVEYDALAFSDDEASMVASLYRELLGVVLSDPGRRVRQAGRRQRRSSVPPGAPVDTVWRVSVVDKIVAVAKSRPHAAAVVGSRIRRTYRELVSDARALASRLLELGVAPGELVPVVVSRSGGLPIAALGVMMSGACFVPVDHEESGAALEDKLRPLLASGVCIVDSDTAERVRRVAGRRRLLRVDRLAPATRPSLPRCRADDLAYGIFTSGTTGVPKLALLEHGGLSNLAGGQRLVLGIRPDDRVLQHASHGFDAMIAEVMVALCAGAALCVPASLEDRVGRGLHDFIKRERVTAATLPPAVLAGLPRESLSELRLLCVAGDACSRELVDLWAGGREFWNLYGPSECSVWASAARLRPGEEPHLGSAAPNTELRIVAPDGELAPQGVVGEIHICGLPVGRGYFGGHLGADDGFYEDADIPGRRCYRTGDLAVWTEEGRLVFVGRRDNQVKVRGVRIELEGVERIVSSVPGVDDVAVVRGEADSGLVACVVSATPSSVEAGWATVRERLPATARPVLKFVSSLPRNASGKVVREQLTGDRWPSETQGGSRVEPSRAAALWNLSLGLPSEAPASYGDDYFQVGGYSLGAVRLIERIEEDLGASVSLAEFLQQPTLGNLAELVERGGRQARRATEDPDRDLERLSLRELPAARRGGDRVLVTGATGALGPALVRALLAYTTGPIACLVRGSSKAEAQQRLEATLERVKLHRSERQRVHAVVGDLAGDSLGQVEEELVAAGDLGAVVHAGASVNFAYTYDTLRDVNVGGTARLLKLAARLGATFNLVSSLSVFEGRRERGPIAEDEALPTWRSLATGYARTKWVCEGLVERAAARGLGTRVFRPSLVVSAADELGSGGAEALESLVRVCLALGLVPRGLPLVDVIPARHAADLIARACLREECLGQTLHVASGVLLRAQHLLDAVRSAGIEAEQVNLHDWVRLADEAGLSGNVAVFLARHRDVLPSGEGVSRARLSALFRGAAVDEVHQEAFLVDYLGGLARRLR